MALPEQTIAWLRQAARLGEAGALAHLDHVERLDALEARVALLEQRSVPGAVELAAEADEPADDEAQTLHSIALKMVDTLERLGVLPEILDTLRRAIREPMKPPAAAAAPVATNDELRRISNPHSLWRDLRRAIYDYGRAHGTPPSVVEALQKAEAVLIETLWVSGRAAAALPAIRSALQLLGQPAPAAAPEPIEPKPEAQPAEDAAPAGSLVKWITAMTGCGDGASRVVLREVAAWLDHRGNRGSANELREEAASQEDQANG